MVKKPSGTNSDWIEGQYWKTIGRSLERGFELHLRKIATAGRPDLILELKRDKLGSKVDRSAENVRTADIEVRTAD